MRTTKTENAFLAFQRAVAEYYGADLERVMAGKSFAITEPKDTILLDNIQNRADFLSKINYALVGNASGQVIFGGTEKLITGRKKNARYTTDIAPSGHEYKCAKTDSGVLIPWERLDQWGELAPHFAQKWAEFVQRQIALDEIKVGFYGESAAENTSKENGEDINVGWLQLARTNAASQILTKGKEANKIKIFGEGADYVNLDELAYDLKQGLHTRHQDAGDLVFLVGSDLVAKEASLIYKGNGLIATEKDKLGSAALMRNFGGMPAMTVPNMPARAAIVTSLDNLSIYTQRGSMRRSFRDDEDKAAVVDSYYRNQAYAVEDFGKFAAVEFKNVVLGGDSAEAA